MNHHSSLWWDVERARWDAERGKTTPSEPNRERYPLADFMALVAKRLEKGRVEYGPESYLTDNVTRQIEEELLDVAGWASLMWAKLQRVEELWKELEELVRSEGER